MDKEYIFKETILPVLESVCQTQGQDVGVFIKNIIDAMYKCSGDNSNDEANVRVTTSRQ